MRRAVVIEVVRSPFCRARRGGALEGLHPVSLYAQVLRGLVTRVGIDPALIEDVITGCVLQVGEQSGNIGRQAVLAAGFPETVPAVTLDRKCGSAQQAIDFAAQGIIAGAYDIVIAGGVEMMSVVPMRANRLGRDNEGPEFHLRYAQGLVHQGIAAELIAARFGLTRPAMDEFALRSHQRAAAAEDAGITHRSMQPIRVPGGQQGKDKDRRDDVERTVTRDDGLRRDTSLAKLATVEPSFKDSAGSARFPEIGWNVTAGNSSQVSDGAAAVLLMEEQVAVRHNLRPRAAVTHFAVAAGDPIMMLTAVIPATKKLLTRAGMGVDAIDSWEVSEAFSSVVLAWQQEIGANPDRVNRYGGAIALGHPVGASGGRLLANLLASLENIGGRYGIQAMCESGGLANATLIERL